MSNCFTASPEPPALTRFRDKLLAAFRMPDDTNDIKLASSEDGWDWTVTCVTHQESAAGVDITVFNDTLWMVFRGNDSQKETYYLYLTWSKDGKNWEGKHWREYETFLERPSIVVFQGKLFLAFRQDEESITVVQSGDGKD